MLSDDRQGQLTLPIGAERALAHPSRRWLGATCAIVSFLLFGAACGDELAPPFPVGQGQKLAQGPSYPPGPYGVTKGATMTNFAFDGFSQPSVSKSAASIEKISLSDFYNASGDETFADGSPYGAGNPKPKALIIDVSAVWCAPCQYESKSLLPNEYAKYHPLGTEFFLLLADGAQVGVPAGPNELVNWVTKFNLNFPAGIDPGRKLGASFSADAFPVNMLVDTRTMTIVEVVAGVPEEGGPFFQSLEATLAK